MTKQATTENTTKKEQTRRPLLEGAGVNDEKLSGPHFVLTNEGEVLGEDTAENREIVRRIHACVNACEGISTKELEAGLVQDMSRIMGEVIPLLQEREQMAKILNTKKEN